MAISSFYNLFTLDKPTNAFFFIVLNFHTFKTWGNLDPRKSQ